MSKCMFCRNGKCCIYADLKCENEFAFKDKTGKEIILCTDAEADNILKDETIKVKLSEMKKIAKKLADTEAEINRQRNKLIEEIESRMSYDDLMVDGTSIIDIINNL